MMFWDSSAVVPLVCREAESAKCLAWARADASLVVWALASLEVTSGLARKKREGVLTGARFETARARLRAIEDSWAEVTAWDAVRERARRLLETHALSGADSLHLAAALVLSEERPRGLGFVTLDRSLAEAASREGFSVLTAES
jgi:predicted nucleic acid-binding protein